MLLSEFFADLLIFDMFLTDLTKMDDNALKNPFAETPDNLVPLPIKGSAAAGKPIEILEFDQGSVLVDKNYSRYNSFLARVQGDSMIDAKINDGDYVVIRPQSTIENGEIALVDVDGEATIKYFYKKDGGFELRSANKAYQPMLYSAKNRLRVAGKVIDVIPQSEATMLMPD